MAEDRLDEKGGTLADKLIAKYGDALRKAGEEADPEETEGIFQELPEWPDTSSIGVKWPG